MRGECVNIKEIFLPIKGFDGYYISNFGNVKSFKKNKIEGRMLKGSPDKDGYLRVGLVLDDKVLHKKIHRLVLENFKPCPNMETLLVDHIDRNVKNNNITNLRWVNAKENARNRKDNRRVIRLPDKKIYGSLAEAAEDNNAFKTHIYNVCIKKRKTAKGYRFFFYDEKENYDKIIKEEKIPSKDIKI